MTIALNNDEKTLILLHYENLLMEMCNGQCEYQHVEKLTNVFGIGNNYVQGLRERFFDSGILDRQSEWI